ncbi:hypothetical protein PG999_006638 [Apiospora kogelbergensis]|uniref:Acetoacetate decarboxylase n=1 Tax=Apiospora kogelbergensis TaxID=1337665 RepID=A0AAW0QW18_9PEZI
MEDKSIVPVPAPWKLKGTVYMISFWAKAGKLPDFTYSPLEAASDFANPILSGQHLGGLSQFQIIRYTESPVGPYDELIVCPGFFNYQADEGGQVKTKKNARITRIYVSQKYTCWNGRKSELLGLVFRRCCRDALCADIEAIVDWNIPKHLARFEFDDLPDGSTKVKVYPHDTTDDVAETRASESPFFQATIQPIKWSPYFPLSSDIFKYIGIDASLAQPPLPAGDGSQKELPGTERWCKVVPDQKSRKACLAWVDMSQRGDKEVPRAGFENFWPGMGRWQLGLKMEDAEIVFGDPVYWNPSQSKL